MVDITTTIMLLFGVLCSVILIVVLRWIEYKQSEKQKDRPPDPIIKAFTLALITFLAICAGELFGAFPKGSTAKLWWVYIAVFAVMFLFYLIVIHRRMPMNLEQQLRKTDDVIYRIYKGRRYGGYTNFLPLDACRTTAEAGRNNVGDILITYNINGPIQFFVQWDKITWELLTCVPYPSANIKNRLLEKVLSKQRDVLAEEFGVGQNDAEKEKVNE